MNSIFFIYRLIKKAEQRTDRLESLGKNLPQKGNLIYKSFLLLKVILRKEE